MFKKYQIGTC